MPKNKKRKSETKTGTTANLGFEAKLWAAADALRNNMDAAKTCLFEATRQCQEAVIAPRPSGFLLASC